LRKRYALFIIYIYIEKIYEKYFVLHTKQSYKKGGIWLQCSILSKTRFSGRDKKEKTPIKQVGVFWAPARFYEPLIVNMQFSLCDPYLYFYKKMSNFEKKKGKIDSFSTFLNNKDNFITKFRHKGLWSGADSIEGALLKKIPKFMLYSCKKRL